MPKYLRIILRILAIAIICISGYLLLYPFYPEIEYQIKSRQSFYKEETSILKSEEIKDPSGKRLIINKIGVNIEIIESDNEDFALNKGAWLLPNTSTPDKGGNTVITAHRFKYRPPAKRTFYHLNKLRLGDEIKIWWQKKLYQYKVVETKVIEPSDNSILKQTQEPTLTLFTCTPLFTDKNRLVVRAKLTQ